MHPCPRPDVEHVIGLADRLLVMLDDDDGVALVAQVLERLQQPVVVALVQADRRLVEHVEHAGQARADLGGEPDALALAARQRAGRAAERQVVQPDIHKETKAFADFLEDRAGDLVLLCGQAVGDGFDPVQRVLDRQLHRLADMAVSDAHRQRLVAQTVAAAGVAGPVVLVALEFLADPARVGLAVAPLHVRDHALEGARDLVDPPALVIAELDLLARRAVQHDPARLFRQVAPARLGVEAVMLGDRLDGLAVIGRFRLGPGRQRAAHQRQVLVGHDQALVEEQLHPQPVAVRAGAEGRVEREQARLDLGDGEARDRAGEILREDVALGVALARCCLDHRDAVGEVERGAQAVGQPRLQPVLDHDTVDDDVDVVAELLVQLGRRVELVELSVDLHALETLLGKLLEFLAIFALAVANDRRQQIGAGALVHAHDPVDHVLHLLRLDGQAGGGRVRRADAREQQAQVVVDLRHRADGRARVLAGGLLLDADRRAEALDMVHVRLLHHVEELPGIGRQRFDIAALPLGIDRVEGQRRLARAGKPGDDHQLVARNIDVDRLEVVLARAADFDGFQLSHTLLLHQPLKIRVAARIPTRRFKNKT